MVNVTINGRKYEVSEGQTILEACREQGIYIPSLCYLKEINEIGACRVCCVEITGRGRLLAACNSRVEEGMEIFTDTPRIREARKTNVELILSQHHVDCPSCVRSETCELKKLAADLQIRSGRFEESYAPKVWSTTFPLQRDASKCIKCMRCVATCEKVQGIGVWDVSNTGSRTTVDVSFNREIKESDCVLCGQCITHCPTAALQERDDTELLDGLEGVLSNPEKVVIAQIAPAVRTAWGETYGLNDRFATDRRLVSALKEVGFDYVFDTDFTADLTIMEEGTELLERLMHRDEHPWPMFTSCCPGWIRFVKSRHPELTKNLSTAKSPQQMFGAVAKTYFAKRIGVDPKNIVCVSIMPCLAKKMEITLPGMDSAGTGQDVDYVLTTREMCRLLKGHQIDASRLAETEFDSPLGTASGAGVIFGASGGVMEAALRTAYRILTGENPSLGPDSPIRAVRGSGSVRELTLTIGEHVVRCAVVNSLGEAEKLLLALRRDEAAYDFVEVMACPGGCIGGGGQPIHPSWEKAPQKGRTDCLYRLDEASKLRFSHENPEVLTLYREFLGQPQSELAHHLLHTGYEDWEMPGPVRPVTVR